MVANGGAQMIYNSMNEEDVKYIMKYPFSMFAADAGIRVFGQGMPHPRGYGTNSRVLGKYVREEKVISLEDASITSTTKIKTKLTGEAHICTQGIIAIIFNNKSYFSFIFWF